MLELVGQGYLSLLARVEEVHAWLMYAGRTLIADGPTPYPQLPPVWPRCTAEAPSTGGAGPERDRLRWAPVPGRSPISSRPGPEVFVNDTVITVLGNVGSDVRQVVTGKGAVLTSFRLASTPRWPDRQTGEWVDGTTTWYSVVAWRNLADNIASSLSKGDPVLVHGRLRTVAWERDGRSGETLEIEALSVGPDLNRGRATYRRVLRPNTDRAARSDAGSPGTEPAAESGSAGGTGSAASDPAGGTGAEDGVGPDDEHGADGRIGPTVIDPELVGATA